MARPGPLVTEGRPLTLDAVSPRLRAGGAIVVEVDDQSPFGRYRPSPAARRLVEITRATWLNRYPLRRACAALFARLHSGPVDYQVWGQQVRLYPWSNASDRRALWRPHRLDPQELAFLVAGMRRRAGATFLDVGANSGFYTLFAALHAGRDPRILAFEPHPVLHRRMAFNLRSLGSADVRLVPVALGDRDGPAVLAPGPDLGASRLDDRPGGLAVTMRRLPTVLAEHGVDDVDVLKIDVEGFEDRVLQPLFDEAPEARWPRHLLIEHVWRAEWRYDCLARARTLGYREVFATRNNLAMSRAA